MIVSVRRSSRADRRPTQYDAAIDIRGREYMYAGQYSVSAAYPYFDRIGWLPRCLDENDGLAIASLGSEFFNSHFGRKHTPVLLGSVQGRHVAYLHLAHQRVMVGWCDVDDRLHSILCPILIFNLKK